jgi:hypothetical protein
MTPWRWVCPRGHVHSNHRPANDRCDTKMEDGKVCGLPIHDGRGEVQAAPPSEK